MGQMIIVYCDKCGLRVTETDLGEGRAVQTHPNTWLCPKCAPPIARPPTSANQTQRKTKTSANKTLSSSRRNANAMAKAEHDAANAQPGGLLQKYSVRTLALVGSGVMLLLIGIIFTVLHKSKPDSSNRVANDAKSPSAQTTKEDSVNKSDSVSKTGTASSASDANRKQVASGISSAQVAPIAPVVPVEIKTPMAAQVVRAERAKEADDEMANLRNERAVTVLEQHKNWFQQNAADPWQYRKRLKEFVASNRSTPAAAEALKLIEAMKELPPPPPVQDLMKDFVPDSQSYQLVYDIDLAKVGHDIVYDTDNRSAIKKPFDRIAYFIEMTPTDGTAQYLYVSLDAFTDDLGKIGIPTIASGATFQQNVTNMLVSSNVSTIVTGSIATGGNIEFWASNYDPVNSANVPEASSEKFDFGDRPTNPPDGYGSMQIHNHDAKQTLFALNHWVNGEAADLGIGNAPSGNPDWTFSSSAANYRAKRLRVLVHLK